MHTFPIKDDNSAEALRLMSGFCILSDSLYALEVALCATQFSHGHTEWALSVIKATHGQTLEMLQEMVSQNGYAELISADMTEKFQRGILSNADYYWGIAFALRQKFLHKN